MVKLSKDNEIITADKFKHHKCHSRPRVFLVPIQDGGRGHDTKQALSVDVYFSQLRSESKYRCIERPFPLLGGEKRPRERG